MPKRLSNNEDFNQAAARIVAQTTGEPPPKNILGTPHVSDEEKKLRSQAASILGKLGGSKGGKARAKNLSAKRRKEIAQAAASVRWSKNLPDQE